MARQNSFCRIVGRADAVKLKAQFVGKEGERFVEGVSAENDMAGAGLILVLLFFKKIIHFYILFD